MGAEPKMAEHWRRCAEVAELIVPQDCAAAEGRDVIVFLAAQTVDTIMTGKPRVHIMRGSASEKQP